MIKSFSLGDFAGISPKQAIELQKQMASQVRQQDEFSAIRQVAGVDVGFEQGGEITRAAIAVLDYPGLQLLDSSTACVQTSFPYIPGLLSFREIPAIMQAIDGLKCLPEVFLCDGQGLAHPRRFGIACHLGLLTNLPAIGVAKSRLIGHYDDLSTDRGACQWLYHHEERIGAVLRTRKDVKPLYISVGHRISLETAIKVVSNCTTRFRLPETTRHAHRLASG